MTQINDASFQLAHVLYKINTETIKYITYSLPLDRGKSSLGLAGLLPLDLLKGRSGVDFCRRSGLLPVLLIGVRVGLRPVLFVGGEGLAFGTLNILEGLVPRDPGGVLWRLPGRVTIFCYLSMFLKIYGNIPGESASSKCTGFMYVRLKNTLLVDDVIS